MLHTSDAHGLYRRSASPHLTGGRFLERSGRWDGHDGHGSRARYGLFLDAAADLALAVTQGRADVLDWGTALLADLRLTRPREPYQQLISYLDWVIVHHLTFPAEPFNPAPAFRAILAAA